MSNFHNFPLLLTLFFLLLPNPTISKNGCTDKCGSVHIQFPFNLKNNNTNQTNAHGFDLSCTNEHETVLEFPTIPLKLFIKRIDYISQRFQIYDPKNCLSSQLLKLKNLSVSPFRFHFHEYNIQRNVSFFRCDSNNGCSILQRDFGGDFIDPELVSCRKVSDVMSVGWVVEEWDEDDLTESLIMEWSKPNCSFCEVQGQKCKWKDGGGSRGGEVECFVCPSSGIARSTVLLITAGMLHSFFSLLLAVY